MAGNILLRTTREFTAYSIEILVDVFLGVICGVLLDLLVKTIVKEMQWSQQIAVMLQLFGICLVLYMMMKGS